MDFLQNMVIIFIGFTVWTVIAPRLGSPRYSELFLAYMTALLVSLIASSELLMVKPVAFFFTVGGVFAFCLELAKKTVKITIRK